MTQQVVVPVVPDYLGGLVQRIRAYAPTMAKIGAQISTALGSKWPDHTYAVLLRRSSMLPMDQETQRWVALVDTFWYGPSEYEAMALWDMTHFWICPDGLMLPNTYRPGPARLLFDSVQHMAGPSFQVEQRTSWPNVLVRYLVRFSATDIP